MTFRSRPASGRPYIPSAFHSPQEDFESEWAWLLLDGCKTNGFLVLSDMPRRIKTLTRKLCGATRIAKHMVFLRFWQDPATKKQCRKLWCDRAACHDWANDFKTFDISLDVWHNIHKHVQIIIPGLFFLPRKCIAGCVEILMGIVFSCTRPTKYNGLVLDVMT